MIGQTDEGATDKRLNYLFSRDASMMQQLQCPAAPLQLLQAMKGSCCQQHRESDALEDNFLLLALPF